jgi:hypothetical protein
LQRTKVIEVDFVFGGCIVLHRRFLLSLVVALSLSTLAFANSATVNMTFLYPGTNVSGGYYTHPFYFSINGGKATHKAAGIIFMGVVNGTIDAKVGNGAVWNLFVKGITTDAAVLALESNALFLAKHAPAHEFKGLVLDTSVGGGPGHGPQEFIGHRGTPLATAEPGRLMLLSTGLIGIAGMLRRNLVRA